MSKNPKYIGGERFNKLSKKDGYRSRAASKLKQINKSHNLIKKNQNILDIGCAPGSWIQVIKELTKDKASITGIDILPMVKIEGITFLQKDLLEVDDMDLNGKLDLVLSDIAISDKTRSNFPLRSISSTSNKSFWRKVIPSILTIGSMSMPVMDALSFVSSFIT